MKDRMMNKKHQNTLVVRADVIMPDTIYFGNCKELERLSGKKVLAKGKDERDTILTRPVKWTIEKLGDELFSCVTFLVSREEILKIFGLAGEGLFSPDETEKELKIEAPIPPGVNKEMFFTFGALVEMAFAKQLGVDTTKLFSKMLSKMFSKN